MSNETIENSTLAPEAELAKGRRKPAKKESSKSAEGERTYKIK